MKKSKLLFFMLIVPCIVCLFYSAPNSASKNMILATTTSTQDSGLLDVLIPAFEKDTGYKVKTISVGSGQAMKMGEKGEADVLLVHSPADEVKLVDAGFGINRKLVMHNDFIIVGPSDDPAKIKGLKTAKEAFVKISQSSSLFFSRGDKSGTNAKELAIWKAAGVTPDGNKWYQQTGLGMGETLNVSSEKRGYTLTDRGTFLALNSKKRLDLAVLVEGEAQLLNIYHVIEVNPAKWPKVNAAAAKAFSGYILSPKVQKMIGAFGTDKFGFPLFFPDAGKKEEALGR
jgi:tungstate transport system substrate-binding protein